MPHRHFRLAAMAAWLFTVVASAQSAPFVATEIDVVPLTASSAPFVATEIDVVPLTASSAAFGDYDDDGDYDLFLAGEDASGALRFLIYDNEGGTFVESGIDLPGFKNGSIDLGDIDKDNDLDLLLLGEFDVGDSTASRTLVYRNDGGTFALQYEGTGYSHGEARFTDVNLDGYPEYLAIGYCAETGFYGAKGRLGVIEGYELTETIFTHQNLTLASLEVGNFNQDELPDVFITGMKWDDTNRTRRPRLLFNNGQVGTRLLPVEDLDYFEEKFQFYINVAEGDASAIMIPYEDQHAFVGDVMIEDLLLTGEGVSGESLSGAYISENYYPIMPIERYKPPPMSHGKIGVRDVDRDGAMDYVSSGVDESGDTVVYYCRYDAASDSYLVSQILDGAAFGDAALADVDLDGDADLFVCGERGGEPTALLYRNDSPSPAKATLDAPANLKMRFVPLGYSLSWSEPDLPPYAYTVNIAFGTTPDSFNVVAPSADLETGFLKRPFRGNRRHTRAATIPRVEDAYTFYYTAQFIDAAGNASAFAPIDSFIVDFSTEDPYVAVLQSPFRSEDAIVVFSADGLLQPGASASVLTPSGAVQTATFEKPSGSDEPIYQLETKFYSQGDYEFTFHYAKYDYVDREATKTINVSYAETGEPFRGGIAGASVSGRAGAGGVAAYAVQAENDRYRFTINGALDGEASVVLPIAADKFDNLRDVAVFRENGEGVARLETFVDIERGAARALTSAGGEFFVDVGDRPADILETPDDYALGRNYPNPFNPVTVFEARLPVEAEVSVEAFDATGAKVRTLLEGTYPAGTLRVGFDGSDLSGGVYFYRMIARGADGSLFRETGKALLLK